MIYIYIHTRYIDYFVLDGISEKNYVAIQRIEVIIYIDLIYFEISLYNNIVRQLGL